MATKPDDGSESGTGESDIIDISTESGNPKQLNFDDGDVIPLIEPESIKQGQSTSSSSGKRRGRKPGSKNSAKQEKQTATDLTGILFGLHTMMAALVKTPELELEESEAKRLGEAIVRVNAQYDNAFFLTEKQQAWLSFGMAAGSIYGPRYIAYSMRKKQEGRNKADGKNKPVLTVFPQAAPTAHA